ncbi:UDP-N-acetylmuramate dehydrogenase [Xylanibacter caecicola]|uniref:UDP-N-acetylmuramate dehydrogenase n=1 Tax=Xylanibacter caecicola TaxID=2736294 RepID=UPI002583E27A|nr:UDP-N-acetylmuramate dehydrogenase [Xylanibacter caecicola]
MKDIKGYSLAAHNTFGIDAGCSRFIEFDNVAELKSVLRQSGNITETKLIIGGGSNLLLTGDYAGTVFHSAIKGFTCEPVSDGVLLRCGSGETWDDIVALCVDNDWYGMENLSLIPGEVGASAVQNIGAYGVEAKDLIYKVEAVEISTGKTYEFSCAECGYSYRHSRFKGEWRNRFIITYVTYRLFSVYKPCLDYGNIRGELARKGISEPTARQLRETIIDIRNAKLPDPKIEGNAGSFFMNPVVPRSKYEEIAALYPDMPHYTIDENHEKIPAGWMIDVCGWKGKTLGNAGVHDKQALVLVNRGGASGSDIVALCEAIRKDVRDRFGIEIHPEVNIV